MTISSPVYTPSWQGISKAKKPDPLPPVAPLNPDSKHAVSLSLADWNAVLSALNDARDWNEREGFEAIARECDKLHRRLNAECLAQIVEAFDNMPDHGNLALA